MALSRGYQAVANAKRKMDEQRAQRDAARTPEIYLRGDGDKCTFYLNGEEDEPLAVDMHFFKSRTKAGKDRFIDIVCAAGEAGHQGCVACYSVGKGDNRLTRATPKFFWSVADTRYVHKSLDAAATAAAGGKYERFTWTNCKSARPAPNAKVCKLCKDGVEREMRGGAKLKCGVSLAGVMETLNETAASICAGCGQEGEITGYRKGKKTLDDVHGRSDAAEWTPVLSCGACETFEPSSLRDCPLTMTRSGTGQGTNYNIVAGKSGPVPGHVADVKPIDFEGMFTPLSADAQAELLGIKNPFNAGKAGAVAYDGEEEEPDLFAEPEEETEEEEDE